VTVLFDTNVVLDVLLDRQPHVEAASQLFAAAEKGEIRGSVGATTVTTIHYLAAKAIGRRRAKTEIRRLLKLFDVAAVTRAVLEGALEKKGFADFEDAVIHEAARHAAADAIVTRNTRHFTSSAVQIYSPDELVRVLETVRSEAVSEAPSEPE
jgi:predicted nucleic acid-binding protein